MPGTLRKHPDLQQAGIIQIPQRTTNFRVSGVFKTEHGSLRSLRPPPTGPIFTVISPSFDKYFGSRVYEASEEEPFLSLEIGQFRFTGKHASLHELAGREQNSGMTDLAIAHHILCGEGSEASVLPALDSKNSLYFVCASSASNQTLCAAIFSRNPATGWDVDARGLGVQLRRDDIVFLPL